MNPGIKITSLTEPRLLGCALLVLLAGCAGSARVYVTALDFQSIDPPAGPAPRFVELDMDRCSWWTDDAGHVWVAMERDRPVLFMPEWRFRFQLSFALDDPPAGRARDYRVTKRELRGTARFGPTQSRFVSLAGIVALYREPGDRFRGSFRIEVAREVQQILGGWGRPTRYLMMGTFNAVPDDGRGRRVAAETESLGTQRGPSPASRPAAPADR